MGLLLKLLGLIALVISIVCLFRQMQPLVSRHGNEQAYPPSPELSFSDQGGERRSAGHRSLLWLSPHYGAPRRWQAQRRRRWQNPRSPISRRRVGSARILAAAAFCKVIR